MSKMSFTVALKLCGLLLLTTHSWAATHVTNGIGGIPCGNKLCAPNAICEDDVCVCMISYVGNGYFCCVGVGEVVDTHIVSDPLLTTFENEHANIAIPCRYSLTEFSTVYRESGGIPAGVCTVQIRPFQRKDKGKFFIAGYDFALQIDYDTGTNYSISLRKQGLAYNGTYEYTVNATDGVYEIDGPFADDPEGIKDQLDQIVGCQFLDDINLAFILVSDCGIFVKFRPYDIESRQDQLHVPGLMIGVTFDHGEPIFDSDNISVALQPQNSPFNQDMASLSPLSGSNTAKIIHRALTSLVSQDYNDGEDNLCNVIGTDLSSACPESSLLSIYKACLWMLTTPKFIRCVDDTYVGSIIVTLFGNCVRMFCGSVQATCSEIESMIATLGCSDSDPAVQAFVDQYC